MSWHTTPYTVPLVFSTVLSAVLTVYAWRRRGAVPAAAAFALMMAGLAEWTLAYALELSAEQLAVKKLFACLRYPGIAMSVLGFLAVALHFVGRGASITPGRMVAALVIPAGSVVFALTNDAHLLMWTSLGLDPAGPALLSEHGPWFWLHMAYCYGAMLVASVLVVRHGARAGADRRRQSAVMLASVAVPWLVSAIHLSGAMVTRIDPTPFALIVSGLGFMWAVFRFRLLDILPVARAAVIENMADGMMVLDRNHRVLDLNAAGRNLIGGPASQALGRPAGEVLAAFPQIVDRYRDVMDGAGEVEVGTGEGRRHYDLRISPLRDEAGEIGGRVLVWRDVTSLKATERELLEQKGRLEQLARRQTIVYEALRLVGGQLDAGNVARVAVQTIARLTDWPNVLLAVPDASGRLVFREARRRFAGTDDVPARGVITRAFATARTQNVPDVSTDPDYVADHPAIRSELAVPLRRGGRVLGVLNLESDGAEAFGTEDVLLAESLADAISLALENARLYQASVDDHGRLEAVIEASRDGLLFVDGEGRVRVLNERASRLLRLLAGPEEWLGRPASELLTTLRAWAPEVDQGLRSALRGSGRGDTRGQGENDVGGRRVSWSVLPVRAGADAMGHLVVLRDVTEERLVESLRDDMTHTMVHDLRNPLTAVSGAVELLELSVSDPRLGEVVKIARASSDRMFSLVNGILEVSRLESGRVPLECARLLLPPVLEETVQLQTPLTRERNLRLECSVRGELPAAWADRSLVSRVLQNLVGNALKFTPEGTVRLEASLHDDTQMLRVDVHDDGPGIPDDLHPRLFQKFVTGRHKNRGSGLGLAFCRLAVEAHGGRIWADAGALKGARFSFTLPVAR